MRSLSHPLACMAFLLLLLFGVQVVHAGDAESSADVCISASAAACQWPANKYNHVPCCPADRPICTTFKGHHGCFSLDELEGGDDLVARADGYPYSTISLDFGDAEPSTTADGAMYTITGMFETDSIPPIIITGAWTIWDSSTTETSAANTPSSSATLSASTEVSSYATPSSNVTASPYRRSSMHWNSSATPVFSVTPSSVTASPDPWSSVHLSIVTLDPGVTVVTVTKTVTAGAAVAPDTSVPTPSASFPTSSPDLVSILGISISPVPTIVETSTIHKTFTGGTVAAPNAPVSRCADSGTTESLPLGFSVDPPYPSVSELPIIPISDTTVTVQTIAVGTYSNFHHSSVVVSSTLESLPRWSHVPPAASHMRAIDSTISTNDVVVSGHYTGPVASMTTTYSHHSVASNPVFSEYTDTYWPGPITARTSSISPPAATLPARELTIADGNAEAITFHPLSLITDGSGLLPSSHPAAGLAARELTSISIAESDVTTITVMNAKTTYPLAMITNSAALIPSSCRDFVTATGSTGTPLYYTFVARGCTGAPTTTISSTSTTTSTSVIDSFKKAAVAAAVTSMSSELVPSSELKKTTVSITTTGTCGSAGTVTVVVQATPSTSTITVWYNTTIIDSSMTSSLVVPRTTSSRVVSSTTSSPVVSSSEPSASSSESSDPSSTADAVTTEVSMSSSMLSSVVTPPTTPMTPTTPDTPGTPTPTVFNGGAGIVQVSHGMLAMLTVAFLLLQ